MALCGCRTPPAEIDDGFKRVDCPAFTPQEKVVVVAARRAIEENTRRKIDAYYRVRHDNRGYSVLVVEVYRYVRGQPRFTIGRDWAVDLDETGKVINIGPSE